MDCDDGVWSHYFVCLVGWAICLVFTAMTVVVCVGFLRFGANCDAILEGDAVLLVFP